MVKKCLYCSGPARFIIIYKRQEIYVCCGHRLKFLGRTAVEFVKEAEAALKLYKELEKIEKQREDMGEALVKAIEKIGKKYKK